jgi:hypothetical protein
MRAIILSPSMYQLVKKTAMDGIVIIVPIMVPLIMMLFWFGLVFSTSLSPRNHNKNQMRPTRFCPNHNCFIFSGRNKRIVASYKKAYSTEQSINFIIPIMILLFLGIVYMASLRSGHGSVSFILIGIAAASMIYWGFVIKKMTKTEKPKYTVRDSESKNWVFDLIRGENEIVFVAEVPGPDDKIMVRLIEGVLYIRGSGNFSKEVPIEGASDMQIHDFKYRNGVLTLRIQKPKGS